MRGEGGGRRTPVCVCDRIFYKQSCVGRERMAHSASGLLDACVNPHSFRRCRVGVSNWLTRPIDHRVRQGNGPEHI